MIIMDKKTVIYIPSAFTAAIKQTAAALSARFGGTTITKNEGAWLDEDKKLIEEPITTLTSWYTSKEQIADVLSVMLDLAANLRNDLKEDCIAIECNGEMMLI